MNRNQDNSSLFSGTGSAVSRIAGKIEEDILQGILAPGAPLRGAREIAAEFGVSRGLIPNVMDLLEKKNLVIRKPRQGVYVNPDQGKKRILVLDSHSWEYYRPSHQITPSIMEEAAGLGIGIETYDKEEFLNLSPMQADSFIRQNHILGVILHEGNFHGSEPIVGLLRSCRIPVVLPSAAENDTAATGFASVVNDTRKNWRMALSYLRSLGFHRIVTQVYDNPDHLIRSFEPGEYLEMLEELNLDTDRDLIISTPTDDRQPLMDKLAVPFGKDGKTPEAIMCFSDFTAVFIYQILEEFGLRIPKDIAVMGYCGARIGQTLCPSLSTIDVGYEEMGRQAVRLLLNAAEWFSPDGSGRMPPRIYPRTRLLEKESTRKN